MQPIYCTWESEGKKAHSPGIRPRVTWVDGWINSAVGSMARILVRCDGEKASEQEWARVCVQVEKGTAYDWDAETQTLTIERHKTDA